MMFDPDQHRARLHRTKAVENYRNMLLGMYPQRDAEVNHQHAARQAYIWHASAAMMAACL